MDSRISRPATPPLSHNHVRRRFGFVAGITRTIAGLCGTVVTAAAADFTPIAYTGEQAPGAPAGKTFGSFIALACPAPALGDDGHVYYSSNVNSFGTVNNSCDGV